MIELPPEMAAEQVLDLCTSGAAQLIAGSNATRILGEKFGIEATQRPTNADTVVAIGGGALLDDAKYRVRETQPDRRLICVPSIWGSGSEASPVVVRWTDKGCEPILDQRYLPDFRAVIPALADSVPHDLARWACADAWSHALEGLLSPLADAELRSDLAELTTRMLRLPVGSHPGWFELSALACAGQARSSVGLVHGLAHTVEASRRSAGRNGGWSHGRYCAAFLLPVLRFDLESSDKAATILSSAGVDIDATLKAAEALWSRQDAEQLWPEVRELWRSVLRDQCTRTNVALVRAASLDQLIGGV